jgi:hypothetical protein
VLLPAQRDSQLEKTAAATIAVGLFARARDHAMGPFRDSASRRATINFALLSYRNPAAGVHVDQPIMLGPGRDAIKGLSEIIFDAAGNANIESYSLKKWDGSAWVPASALR